MASEEMNDYKDVLFGYYCLSAWGCFGKDDGGFSVEIYKDGKMIHKTYIFDQEEKTRTEYKISDESVAEIKSILKMHSSNIDSFDKHINNGSFDGAFTNFVFNGKEIVILNIDLIEHIDIKYIKKNPDYTEEEMSVIKQEYEITLLFSKITSILKKNGVMLSLDGVNFDESNSLLKRI